MLEVDQTPIGKTPRSCPATYIGFWDTIRKLFADTLEAQGARLRAGAVLVSTPARAAARRAKDRACGTIAMSFLPDVKVPCENLSRRAFQRRDAGRELAGQEHRRRAEDGDRRGGRLLRRDADIAHPLQLLKDVGLGYLTLGQPSPTLSGGEAQRIKLVTELSKVRDDVGKRGNKAPHTLYVLDEPTVGLHMADVERLIKGAPARGWGAFGRCDRARPGCDCGGDWVIDSGPEGGVNGGTVVAEAVPEQLVALADSHTGAALRSVLARTAAEDPVLVAA